MIVSYYLPSPKFLKTLSFTQKPMLKGQVVAGDFSKIVVRIKSGEKAELGELFIIDDQEEKI